MKKKGGGKCRALHVPGTQAGLWIQIFTFPHNCGVTNMKRQLWGLQSRGPGGGGGAAGGWMMGVTSAAWIMSGLSITVWTQIRSLTHVESINYPPCLCFVIFSLLGSACKAANRWREDGMWGRCCDWPGKGHAHHVSPCGKSGYVLTP